MATDAVTTGPASVGAVAVSPASLRLAATDVDAAVSLIVSDGGQLAGPGQSGWDCSRQLGVTTQVWVDYLKGLRADLGDLADDLRVLADHFVVVEHDVSVGLVGGVRAGG